MVRRFLGIGLAVGLAPIGAPVNAGDVENCVWIEPPVGATIQAGEPFTVRFSHPDPWYAENAPFSMLVDQGIYSTTLIVEGDGLNKEIPIILHYPNSTTGGLLMQTQFQVPGEANPRWCLRSSATVVGQSPTPTMTPPPNLTPGSVSARTAYLLEIYVAKDTLEAQVPPIYYYNTGTGDLFLNMEYTPAEYARARVTFDFNPVGMIIPGKNYIRIPVTLHLDPDVEQEFDGLANVESYHWLGGRGASGVGTGSSERIIFRFVDSAKDFPPLPTPLASYTNTPLPSPTPSPSSSPTESSTPTSSPSPTASISPTPSPKHTDGATFSPTPTEIATPSPSPNASATPSSTPSPTQSVDANGDGVIDSCDVLLTGARTIETLLHLEEAA